MMERPDLTKLTEQQKDNLILLLFDYIERLEARVKELEERLSKNSSNSSKPPSSDGYKKPDPKSLRNKNKKKKKVGGQVGHKGSTLKQTDNPKFIAHHDPAHCWLCKNSLLNKTRINYERRQVYDLPPLHFEVTEHRAYKKCCGHCGVITKANFPTDVTQSTQYGSKAKSLMIYMHQYQLLPFDRNREFFSDVFSQDISAATIASATEIGYTKLESSENHIKQQLINEKSLHVDETGFRVSKSLFWLHVASTNRLTFYASHKKRGSEAANEIDLLPKFNGILIHDHLKAYFQYAKQHSLCNAHHLRELTFVQENYKHKWAKEIEILLLNIKQAVELHYADTGNALSEKKLKRYRNRYMNILRRGDVECPRNYGDGEKRKAKVKQTTARNLLERLRRFNQSVLAFMYNPSVPFDNNQAERDLRMMKVQQKISGCFRTSDGIKRFCRIRGYISTAKKQGVNVLFALQQAMVGQAILFNA